MATYSFLDTQVAITGPGGSFNIGSGSGNSEEGITITPSQNINTMTIGADGTPMHSLHADKSAKVSVRLLKTSITNSKLSGMVAFQRTSGSLHGQNTITVVNTASGDSITCQKVAFAKIPTISYAKEGGMIEWEFDCGIVDELLGAGSQ